MREVVVNGGDRNQKQSGAEDDPAGRNIALGAIECFGFVGSGGGSAEDPAQRTPQRLAHGEHGAGGAHQHGADRDGPNDVEPNRIGGDRGIVGPDAARQIGIEEQQQRDQDPPGDDAARDVDGGELGSDDVADADERGRKAGRGPRNAAEMRDVADGLLFEVEVLDDGARESEKAFDVFAEDLRAFFVGEDLDERRRIPGRRRCSAGLCWPRLHRL